MKVPQTAPNQTKAQIEANKVFGINMIKNYKMLLMTKGFTQNKKAIITYTDDIAEALMIAGQWHVANGLIDIMEDAPQWHSPKDIKKAVMPIIYPAMLKLLKEKELRELRDLI